MVDITTLVASLPSVFPLSISATLYNEFKVFFQYLDEQRSLEEFDKGGEPLSEISEAANVALKLTWQHGLFKYVSRVYQLFLTAAPSVCKNERTSSALKRVKNYLRSSMTGRRLQACILLSMERDLTYQLDLKELAIKWSLLKERRQKL